MARPWHHHEFKFVQKTDTEAQFKCEHCQRGIGFHLPERNMPPGVTAVDQGDGQYAIPDEAHEKDGGTIGITIGPCDQ